MAAQHPDSDTNPAPPPDLQLQIIVYDDDGDSDNNEENDDSTRHRRPSTTSLSRFRSCPHLASAKDASEDSPGSDMAPITDQHGNIIHTSPSPSSANCLKVDCYQENYASNNPTPPSTPESRRRDIASSIRPHRKHAHSNTGAAYPNTDSAHSDSNPSHSSSIPRLPPSSSSVAGLGVTRTMSMDGACPQPIGDGEVDIDDPRLSDLWPLGVSSQRNSFCRDSRDMSFEDDRGSFTDDASSMHVVGRSANNFFRQRNQQQQHQVQNLPPHLQQQQFHGDEEEAEKSVEKCSRWLQGMRLKRTDKVKSRSHIQLPPV